VYRMTLCAAAALFVATAIQPVTADDSWCSGTGDEAIAACSRLLALKPENCDYYATRGGAYKAKGDYDRAIADYDQVIRLCQDPGGILYINRGDAYRGEGDYNRAIADYDRAISYFNEEIRFHPNDGYSYTYRGEAYKGKGDYDRAISDFDQAIRLVPNLGYAYYYRGEAYEAKNDPDRAIADFDRAVKIDFLLAEAYQGRVRVLLAKRSNPGRKSRRRPDERPRQCRARSRVATVRTQVRNGHERGFRDVHDRVRSTSDCGKIALAIKEKALAPDHPHVASPASNKPAHNQVRRSGKLRYAWTSNRLGGCATDCRGALAQTSTLLKI
jgi:tetratricopeptide (TPR) repeat protein